jgi:hydroxymethylpyrimidine pyrophosphatase-like HAD family hydrolase
MTPKDNPAKFQPLPPPRVIAVDVDGTLHIRGELQSSAVEFCRRKKSEGFDLFLWSSRGKDYAERFAATHGITDLFSAIISKPGHILDDQGWGWIRFTSVITRLD